MGHLFLLSLLLVSTASATFAGGTNDLLAAEEGELEPAGRRFAKKSIFLTVFRNLLPEPPLRRYDLLYPTTATPGVIGFALR